MGTQQSATDQGNSISATQVENEIYEKLRYYPFHTDREFAKGLAIILGHPDTPATETEIDRMDDLVLQAKCFYFSRYARKEQPPFPPPLLHSVFLTLASANAEANHIPLICE